MKVYKFLAPAALLAIVLMALPVSAESEFLFNGYSVYTPSVDNVGSVREVFGILGTVGGIPTPILLDPVNYEYTIYINGQTVNSRTDLPPPPFARRIVGFEGGGLFIYADPIVGGTAADYDNPATFVDGELILEGVVDDGWTMMLMDSSVTPPGTYTGSGSGTFDFIGGTQYDALITAEYLLTDWYLHGLDLSDDNPPATPVHPGYDRNFKAKLTPPNDPTDTVDSTWGQVKTLYR
ncbi:MAG: hypothetical protein ABIF77_16265 [bacterium]